MQCSTAYLLHYACIHLEPKISKSALGLGDYIISITEFIMIVFEHCGLICIVRL